MERAKAQNMPSDPPNRALRSLVGDLAALLHAAAILLRVAERDDVAPIRGDVSAATALLQRCVIRVGRRSDTRVPSQDARGERRHRLSPRERLIVEALVRGASYKDIAHDLDVSLSSVQARVKSIYAKLGVHSKGELRSVMETEGSASSVADESSPPAG
jgi:DNA-binding NarL/FixJ family response regulator